MNKFENNIVKNDQKNKKVDKAKNKPKLFHSIAGVFKNIYNFCTFYVTHYYKSILCILIVILLVIFGIYLYRYFYKKKYAPYEIKMQNYGFDKMYDNGKTTSYENVSKSEAIKIILASIYNVYDTKTFMPETDNEYPNKSWVKYAISIGALKEDEITKDNQNKKVTYAEVLKYYLDSRNEILDKKIKYDKEAGFKDLKKYSSDMQNYINDAVENNLIENSIKKLNANKNITKGQFNMLVTNFVAQYNTIVLKGDKINVNPDKIPSNTEEYPYILSNVDKSVYEKPFNYDSTPIVDPLNPIKTYVQRKEYYAQMKEIVEDYYNLILNIDYTKIDRDKLYNEIQNNYSLYIIYDNDLDKYVNYIKDNKIKISGKAKAQLPIIYFDGDYYRVRTKLDFNIESSGTKDNVLFGDLIENTQNTTYSDKNSIIVDVKLSMLANSKTTYINIVPTYQIIVK